MARVEMKSMWTGKVLYSVDMYRCKDCGALITLGMIGRGACSGHYVYDHVHLTPWERFKLMVGLIR